MEIAKFEKRTIIINEDGTSIVLMAQAQSEDDLNMALSELTQEIFE